MNGPSSDLTPARRDAADAFFIKECHEGTFEMTEADVERLSAIVEDETRSAEITLAAIRAILQIGLGDP